MCLNLFLFNLFLDFSNDPEQALWCFDNTLKKYLRIDLGGEEKRKFTPEWGHFRKTRAAEAEMPSIPWVYGLSKKADTER